MSADDDKCFLYPCHLCIGELHGGEKVALEKENGIIEAFYPDYHNHNYRLLSTYSSLHILSDLILEATYFAD